MYSREIIALGILMDLYALRPPDFGELQFWYSIYKSYVEGT